MIDIRNVIFFLKEKFKNFDLKVDEFKPDELVYIYINYYNDSKFELCFEITRKWIGFSKLDKSIEIDFSSNDEIFEKFTNFKSFIEEFVIKSSK